MRIGFRCALTSSFAVAVFVVLSLGATSARAQLGDYTAPRGADGHPDLNGIWQALNTAHYDLEAHAARPALALTPGPPRAEQPGLGRATPADMPAPAIRALGAAGGVPGGESVVVDGEIPYQPWAAVQRDENATRWLERDPEINCYMPGVPRATYMPYPFQILQGTNEILIAYEFADTTRTIFMNDVGDSPEPTWMGWSRGRWEDDTLVVEVTDLNDRTWFDRAGNFHSDALRVVERYTPMSPYHLMYEATIEDANVFTRPWTIRMPLYRRLETNKRLFEYKCVEYVEQLMYGDLGVIDPETGDRNE
ncbi:MAG: hypothetical protein GWN29_09240 [Gammaproteobacteria bacterium]|nr:hypothetical protein [Gammaproteobacteria bacterium]